MSEVRVVILRPGSWLERLWYEEMRSALRLSMEVWWLVRGEVGGWFLAMFFVSR
jgi:hypothetical protein